MRSCEATIVQTSFRRFLYQGGSVSGLATVIALAAFPQLAQAQAEPAPVAAVTSEQPADAPQSADDGGEIVVTGSRIASGARTPTPVTMVSSESLQRGNPSTPVAALREGFVGLVGERDRLGHASVYRYTET